MSVTWKPIVVWTGSTAQIPAGMTSGVMVVLVICWLSFRFAILEPSTILAKKVEPSSFEHSSIYAHNSRDPGLGRAPARSRHEHPALQRRARLRARPDAERLRGAAPPLARRGRPAAPRRPRRARAADAVRDHAPARRARAVRLRRARLLRVGRPRHLRAADRRTARRSSARRPRRTSPGSAASSASASRRRSSRPSAGCSSGFRSTRPRTSAARPEKKPRKERTRVFSGPCMDLSPSLGCLLRRARSASRTKLHRKAVRGSGRSAGRSGQKRNRLGEFFWSSTEYDGPEGRCSGWWQTPCVRPTPTKQRM